MRIDAEGFADPAVQFAAEQFTAGEDAAQVQAGIFHAGLPHQFQRRRRQERVADGKLGHHRHRRLRFEFARAMADHWNAVIPEREQSS